jgi:hypothetical protein
MPKVSPGHEPLFPNPFEMRTGGVSHPFVMENVRMYSAYPRESLSESQAK